MTIHITKTPEMQKPVLFCGKKVQKMKAPHCWILPGQIHVPNLRGPICKSCLKAKTRADAQESHPPG